MVDFSDISNALNNQVQNIFLELIPKFQEKFKKFEKAFEKKLNEVKN